MSAPERANGPEGTHLRAGAMQILWVNRSGAARHCVLAVSIAALRARLRIRRRVRDRGI